VIRIAIIGGGISGLSAAFALEERRREGDTLDYFVYESSPRFGGVLFSERVEGCLVEAGPDSFLTEKTWAADFCRTLGLGDQLIGSNDATRKTYILVRGRLVPMPEGLMFMVPTKIFPIAMSPLFSWTTKLRMAREWLHSPGSAPAADESIAALISRHYGNEMVDRLADPLLSGVYGGDAAALSAQAVLPRFVEMERTHGSLGRALLAARKKSSESPARTTPSIFTSLKGGMQQLVDSLLARLSPSSLRPNMPVEAIHPRPDGWLVSARGESDFFDAVILAAPTYAAAHLLRACGGELSTELDGIPYSSSVTVALGYDRAVRDALPLGFGFLVPRNEGKRTMAVTFVHNKFAHRAPEDRALLRCFLGGTRDEAALQMPDAELVRVVRDDLREILKLTAEPLFARVYRWQSAMAQYNVGHLDRVKRIENLRSQLPRLALAGNGYGGIGVPDCIRSGGEAARHVLTVL
jgi:protoporphyrinogen/coproporphyrinogen III oxidase